MSRFITLGNISAVLSVLAIMVGAFGKNTLANWLSDPDTAQTVFTFLGALGTLIAGVSPGMKS